MQMQGSARFSVRGVSPTRMVQLFLSRHAPGVKVRIATSASSSQTASTAAATPAADLVRWVEGAGGSVAGVAVQRDEGGFGLAAAQDCQPGATLISLPQRCHLTYDDSSDPRLLALIERVPAELWGAKLALQVVAHRLQGAASPFGPYIANLPLGVAGLPMFFGGEALAELQYPPVTEQVKKRCRWLLGFARDVLAPIRGKAEDPFEGAEVDANALGWALAVVTSRAFRTRGPNQPAAMLPLIDMANHSFEANARIAPGPGGSMLMLATKGLRAGEPVLISYGALPNDFLLLDYGFIMPSNPHDTVQLRFDRGLIEAAKEVAGVGSATGAPDSGEGELPPLPAWQQQGLVALGLAGPAANTEVTIRWQQQGSGKGDGSRKGDGSSSSSNAAAADEGPVDPRLMAGVRLLCAPSRAALGGGPVSVESLGRWGTPLSTPAAELAALRTLSALCAIALSQFPASLEEDVALLEGASLAQQGTAQQGEQQAPQQPQQQLSDDQRLAVRFRVEKKRLLLDALAIISQRVKQLDSTGGSPSSGGKQKQRQQQQQQQGSGGGRGKVPASKGGGRGFGK